MRLIFMGTAPFACAALRRLLASHHQVLAVVTQPDRPRGRGRKPAASAVKAVALEHQCPLLQPPNLRSSTLRETLASLQPEVIVVVAYGHIVPPAILCLPPHGCLNIHASLLPKYRGAAPINWALMQGDTETGCTIIQMDEHIDTGAMLWQASCPIALQDDALGLGERLAELGAKGLLTVLQAIETHTLVATPQPQEGASYAPKLTRELGVLDWQQSALVVHNRIRGLVPWPGTVTHFGEVEVKVWRSSVAPLAHTKPPGTIVSLQAEGIQVACGTDTLLLHEVQPANRRRMPARDFIQGYRVQQGQHFV